MFHIGICDSNANHRNELQKVLNILFFDVAEVRITHYTKGEDVLRSLEGGHFAEELLFLEVALPDMSGLRVASCLRTKNADTDLIFITELERYVYDGYVYHAFDYLLKPISAKKIALSVRRYISEKQAFRNKSSHYLTITSKGNTERLNLRHVAYFESQQRKIFAVTRDETMEFYQKMGDLYEVVRQADFIRCHQSYIVNVEYITALRGRELVLQGGKTLPVSKRYFPEVREKLLEASAV